MLQFDLRVDCQQLPLPTSHSLSLPTPPQLIFVRVLPNIIFIYNKYKRFGAPSLRVVPFGTHLAYEFYVFVFLHLFHVCFSFYKKALPKCRLNKYFITTPSRIIAEQFLMGLVWLGLALKEKKQDTQPKGEEKRTLAWRYTEANTLIRGI